MFWQYIGGVNESRRPVGAITVPPKESRSEEIHYYARRIPKYVNGNLYMIGDNFWELSKFNNAIKDGKISKIRLEFSVDLLGYRLFNLFNESPLTKSCIIYIDDDFKKEAKDAEDMADNGKFYLVPIYSRACNEENKEEAKK